MLGTLQVPGRKHVDITEALQNASEHLDLNPRSNRDLDARYNMTIMGILIEHETALTSEVRGILYDDMDRNISTFRIATNTPQWLAFRHIYVEGTELENRRIKILGA